MKCSFIDSFKLFSHAEVIHSQKRPHSHIRLHACSFIKKRLQDWCFPVKFTPFLKHLFYRKPPVNASVQFNSWS